ncbi:MAG: Co2+/Mg2+ efflux protein ApaG [Alphaproteobacteria bacterium]|nr:Co2+/Mg2+ efflux protein ApaG [Alphaproteobacteria bacterium]
MSERAYRYEAKTRGIRVRVEPVYLDDQSAPEEGRYVWAYHVAIENAGADVVQLRTRYWRITDATGKVQEVRGMGVVGEQPVLKPGERFEYTSGTPLGTASGFMEGRYGMQTPSGEVFDVTIPAFSLDRPDEPRHLH